jgi:hypothetical protein
MSTYSFRVRRPLAPGSTIDPRLPRLRAPAARAWLNQPARYAPFPIVSCMYGIWLRTNDRSDVGREAPR